MNGTLGSRDTLGLPAIDETGVVAIVPAKDSASVGETVDALLGTGRVDAVVVIDDGSLDDTAERARRAGALVVRPGCNLGKGDAVALGRDVAPRAATYLLVDADLGATASHVVSLLDPLESDVADLAVAGFPPAAGRGGFGIIKRGSARAIGALCGAEVAEPLSGQRAVRGELLRSLRLAPRFGLEVGMTVDAVRQGARLVEVPLPLDHAHTGRTVAGFRHRIRQGVDIVRTALVRLGRPIRRRVAMVVLALAIIGAALAWGGHASGPPLLDGRGRPVVVVTLAYAEVEDLADGSLPNLRRLADRAGGALAPRTPSVPADQASGYATVGAGAPVVLVPPEVDDEELEETAGLVGADDETIGAGPFVTVTAGPDGFLVRSPVVPSSDTRSYGELGALGDALAAAGLDTAYVGARSGGSGAHAPAALVAVDGAGRLGHLYSGALPLAPGDDLDARVAERVEQVRDAVGKAGLTVVDTGGAPVARPLGSPEMTEEDRAQRERRRRDQLAVADRFIGALLDARLDATVIVAGLAPPGSWQLTPLALAGTDAGVTWSASTKRPGVAVLTDVAPTVLHLLDLATPDTMVGSPIGAGPDAASERGIEELAERTDARERVYVPTIMTFVILQGVVYLVAVVALGRRRSGDPRGQRTLRAIERLAVGFAAFPVGTFLWRLLPTDLQAPWVSGAGYVVVALGLSAVALRCRRTPLSPLIWVAGLTVAVELWDAATSGALQHVSLLGYTPVTAARFYGMGNMGFAILGATALLVAGSWIATSPDRGDGMVAAACLLATVTVFEVAPSLGADFGGVLTFVPVFGAAVLAWVGVRFTWPRALAFAVLGIGAVAAMVWWEGRSGGDGHLARFAQGDWAAMWDVVVRKASTNLRVMRITFWTWMVPIIVMFIVGSLTVGGGWRRWFGRADTWRVTFAALLGFSIVGGLVNDSGVVIPALALVYVGSFLLLVQSRQPFGPVDVLVPDGANLTPADEAVSV